MTSPAVIDEDQGWSALEAMFAGLDGEPYVAAGVLEEEGAQPVEGGATLAQVAAWNEFGTSHIPERSFLRSTVEEERSALGEIIAKGMGRVVDGDADVDDVLDVAGLYLEGKIKQKITALDTPPNAPSTIAKKGADNPLIDTGRLRSSIGAFIDFGGEE